VYALNNVAYLEFYKQIRLAANGTHPSVNTDTPIERAKYNRDGARFPWRTHLQWLRTLLGGIALVLIIIFQGWRSLVGTITLEDGNDFLATYISVSNSISSVAPPSLIADSPTNQVAIAVILAALYYFGERGFPPRMNVQPTGLAGLIEYGPLVVDKPVLCEKCGLVHRPGDVQWLVSEKPITRRQRWDGFCEWVWTWTR
jgi:hypothetical protein